MEKDHLLPYSKPPPLYTLPENDDCSPSSPFTPSELKEYLIFGASPRDPPSSLVDSLTLHVNPSPPSSSSPLSTINPRSLLSRDPIPKTLINNPQLQSQSQWLLDPTLTLATKKTNLHRSRTAPAMAGINNLHKDLPEKPLSSTDSIVRQAFVLLLLYLVLGGLIYWFMRDHFVAIRTHPVIDAVYFCIVTMCTIGYGDITPSTPQAKVFSILFVLVGFGFIDILMSGMVSHVLNLQETHLLQSIASSKSDKGNAIIDVKKGRMRIRMKVALALGVVILCIGFGCVFVHLVEKLTWLDSLYLSVMSVTTVGYGDKAFSSLGGRMFASVWLLVSTLAVARAFLYLTEARVDKRNRKMAKWVLGQNMTVAQFLAADMDNNGFVSKSEYVIYKLKEMKKVSEKEILQISRQFDRLDCDNCGKITLAHLLDASS